MEINEDYQIGELQEIETESFCNPRSKIPGLHAEATERSTADKNLAPLQRDSFKSIQYGNSSFISINTDHPDWAPGECLNLHKYEGRFRIKLSRLAQQVNGKNSSYILTCHIIAGPKTDQIFEGKKVSS